MGKYTKEDLEKMLEENPREVGEIILDLKSRINAGLIYYHQQKEKGNIKEMERVKKKLTIRIRQYKQTLNFVAGDYLPEHLWIGGPEYI